MKLKPDLSQKRWLLLLPLGGVLAALSLIFPAIGFLQWVTMVPALYYVFYRIQREKMRLRRLYGLGFLYFYPFYLVNWHWFVDLYPMEFAGVSKGTAILLIIICWFGLSLLQTIFSALVFPVLGGLYRTRFFKNRAFLLPFLGASAYTVAEWSQTLTWAGVPWARLALGQVESGVFFNGAALFGSYFITFSIVAVNGLIAYTLLHTDRLKRAAICVAAVLALDLGAGIVGYVTAQSGDGASVTVAAVQANIGSHGKWSDKGNPYDIYEEHIAAAAAAGAEIVVLPETFIPSTVSESSALGKYISKMAKTYKVTLICGGFHRDAVGNRYNGLFTVYPDGTLSDLVYCKQRPVPFGEFVPMRGLVETLVPPLADINMLSSDLLPGENSVINETVAGRMGALICFDSIYENLTLDAIRDGAEVICLSTNDSWFLDSVGVYMHHRQAQLRAVESGRYIIRSADTGISSVILPDGSVAEQLEPLVAGNVVTNVAPRQTRTLYSYIGNALVYLLIIAELALVVDAIVVAVRKKRAK